MMVLFLQLIFLAPDTLKSAVTIQCSNLPDRLIQCATGLVYKTHMYAQIVNENK